MRDAARTKQKILGVAAKEFADKGYDGARVDEIMRRSKVSKNLIYHYFTSKDDLFTAVLEAAYERLRKRQDTMALRQLEPVEGIRRLVIETFRHWSEATDFIGYLNSENFHRARHIKKSKLIRRGYPPLIQTIRDMLEAGQRAGVFRRDVDPVDLYISISALGYHYLANRYTFSIIFERDCSEKQQLENRLQHVENVILGYLQFGAPVQAQGEARSRR